MELPPQEQAAFILEVLRQQPEGEIAEMLSKLPPQVRQIVESMPREWQAEFVQLLMTDPQQAAAKLQEVMGGGGVPPMPGGVAPAGGGGMPIGGGGMLPGGGAPMM